MASGETGHRYNERKNSVKPMETAIESRLNFIRSAGRSTNDSVPPPVINCGVPSILRAPSKGSEQGGADSPGEATDPSSQPVELMSPDQRPRTAAELGIRQSIVEDLALKTLYMGGTMSTRELARQMRLSVNVADELVNKMRAGQLCQVTGMTANLATVALTDQGRKRGLELIALSQYAGAAPVSLESYVSQVRKQSVRNLVVRKADVERAFGDLVIDPKVLGQIGTGLNSGASIFVHGPAGVGKTAIAETMSRVLAEDDVWIPYSIEVDGQMIMVYDPMIHKRVDSPQFDNCDERWVRCRRPSVLVGGELTIDMLDLQFNATTEVLQRPRTDEGQQRRPHRGRLRPPARAPRRSAQSLGRAPRPRHRLPHHGRRQERSRSPSSCWSSSPPTSIPPTWSTPPFCAACRPRFAWTPPPTISSA